MPVIQYIWGSFMETFSKYWFIYKSLLRIIINFNALIPNLKNNLPPKISLNPFWQPERYTFELHDWLEPQAQKDVGVTTSLLSLPQ